MSISSFLSNSYVLGVLAWIGAIAIGSALGAGVGAISPRTLSLPITNSRTENVQMASTLGAIVGALSPLLLMLLAMQK